MNISELHYRLGNIITLCLAHNKLSCLSGKTCVRVSSNFPSEYTSEFPSEYTSEYTSEFTSESLLVSLLMSLLPVSLLVVSLLYPLGLEKCYSIVCLDIQYNLIAKVSY